MATSANRFIDTFILISLISKIESVGKK